VMAARYDVKQRFTDWTSNDWTSNDPTSHDPSSNDPTSNDWTSKDSTSKRTQLRKGLNFERPNFERLNFEKDSTSKRTQLRNWTSNLNFEKPYIAIFIWSAGKMLKRPSQYCLIHYIKQYLHVWSESSNIGLVVLAFCGDCSCHRHRLHGRIWSGLAGAVIIIHNIRSRGRLCHSVPVQGIVIFTGFKRLSSTRAIPGFVDSPGGNLQRCGEYAGQRVSWQGGKCAKVNCLNVRWSGPSLPPVLIPWRRRIQGFLHDSLPTATLMLSAEALHTGDSLSKLLYPRGKEHQLESVMIVSNGDGDFKLWLGDSRTCPYQCGVWLLAGWWQMQFFVSRIRPKLSDLHICIASSVRPFSF
jgi:hypothetical protein